MKVENLCAALFLLFSLCSFHLAGQDTTVISVPLQVDLQEEPGSKFISLLEEKPPVLAGIPQGLDTALYWSFISSYEQNVFDQFQNGEISAQEFAEKDLSPQNYTETKINFKIYGLSGFRNGKKIIVMDSNHNLDFSDEQILELDTTLSLEEKLGDDYRLSPWIKLSYDYHRNGKTYTLSTVGRIDPFVMLMPSPGKLIEDLKFSFISFENYRGTVELDDKKYNLRANRYIPSGGVANFHFYTFGQRPDEQQNIILPVDLEQKIFINGTYYELVDFDLATKILKLKKLPVRLGQKIFGGSVGMKAPVYRGKAIADSEVSQIGGAQDKYFFIHSWGTWCGPCKADHQELIRLQKKYQGKEIEFIGLVVDRDEERVINYMKKNGIDWKHYFFTYDESFEPTSATKQYYIDSFPTYLIVDPEGMIMARGGNGDLKNMIEMLPDPDNK